MSTAAVSPERTESKMRCAQGARTLAERLFNSSPEAERHAGSSAECRGSGRRLETHAGNPEVNTLSTKGPGGRGLEMPALLNSATRPLGAEEPCSWGILGLDEGYSDAPKRSTRRRRLAVCLERAARRRLNGALGGARAPAHYQAILPANDISSRAFRLWRREVGSPLPTQPSQAQGWSPSGGRTPLGSSVDSVRTPAS